MSIMRVASQRERHIHFEVGDVGPQVFQTNTPACTAVMQGFVSLETLLQLSDELQMLAELFHQVGTVCAVRTHRLPVHM